MDGSTGIWSRSLTMCLTRSPIGVDGFHALPPGKVGDRERVCPPELPRIFVDMSLSRRVGGRDAENPYDLSSSVLSRPSLLFASRKVARTPSWKLEKTKFFFGYLTGVEGFENSCCTWSQIMGNCRNFTVRFGRRWWNFKINFFILIGF